MNCTLTLLAVHFGTTKLLSISELRIGLFEEEGCNKSPLL